MLKVLLDSFFLGVSRDAVLDYAYELHALLPSVKIGNLLLGEFHEAVHDGEDSAVTSFFDSGSRAVFVADLLDDDASVFDELVTEDFDTEILRLAVF